MYNAVILLTNINQTQQNMSMENPELLKSSALAGLVAIPSYAAVVNIVPALEIYFNSTFLASLAVPFFAFIPLYLIGYLGRGFHQELGQREFLENGLAFITLVNIAYGYVKVNSALSTNCEPGIEALRALSITALMFLGFYAGVKHKDIDGLEYDF